MNGPTQQETSKGRGIYVGKYLGIEFYLDASWFLLAGLVIWSLASSYFPYKIPNQSTAWYFGYSTAAALIFYLSILLHELGHSVVSQRCGIPVPRITLMFIGGVAEIEREPEDAVSELKIALGGPAVTVVLILIFYAISLASDLLGWKATGVVSGWLAAGNLYLLVFNAIPGYPLDGGRVLRAFLWMRSGKLARATWISSRVGITFAWLLMILGVYLLFRSPLQAFVFFLIGSFLKNAASAGYEHAVHKETLHGIQVSDVMTPAPIVVSSDLPLNLAVDDYFLASHHTAYPVADREGDFRGILRLDHLQQVTREKWPFTTVGDLTADCLPEEISIAPHNTAMEAAAAMSEKGRGQLVVVENGRVVGIVTRHDIFQFIRISQELEQKPAKAGKPAIFESNGARGGT